MLNLYSLALSTYSIAPETTLHLLIIVHYIHCIYSSCGGDPLMLSSFHSFWWILFEVFSYMLFIIEIMNIVNFVQIIIPVPKYPSSPKKESFPYTSVVHQ